jgi:hypothetical protein
MKPMNEPLQRCPFCGQDKVRFDAQKMSIICDTCKYEMHFDLSEQGLEIWDKRAAHFNWKSCSEPPEPYDKVLVQFQLIDVEINHIFVAYIDDQHEWNLYYLYTSFPVDKTKLIPLVWSDIHISKNNKRGIYVPHSIL